VPEGDWPCERCTHLLFDKIFDCFSVKCYLCDGVKGVLSQVYNNCWVHDVCANWLPEVFLKEENGRLKLFGQPD